ncbi:murein biosynthesis integral membrane protein MurJ [Usitatibacter palustris]|uniref:Probable lipid II flippase MurJ n=1 Tax=Usitatibacter palustris TaxID=2732487 RepID=A0A6M4H9I1_9PROT|nr:murein biosynthesis integral membrane protein MurJ [Usitatibacter palustris]QJR16409.1 putative lipid II flippase MurJ [Usitatibacter palustris]
MNLLRAAASVSAMTLASRITGFVRDTLLAIFFGAGLAMDAFVVAFRIPNLLRRLFAEGAFSQAFVPVLGEYKAKHGDEATRALAGRVLGVLGAALLLATAVGIVAAPLIVYASAYGFSKDADKFALTVLMLRICFPYIFFISLVSFAAGLLNTYGRFKAAAFTPVLLNLVFIAFILWVAPHFERPVVALAWAVFFGGLAQLLFQIPFLKRIGMLTWPRWEPRDEGVIRILKLMAPAALGVSVAQISLLINTHIASWLRDGAVSWLYFADRLMEFPSAMLGVALGTVLLPSLVKHHSSNDPREYSRLLDWGLRLALLLSLPAALGLALLATPVITTLFWHGEFTRADVFMTRHALIAYCVGLAGIILVKILAPGFYAKQNIRTPVKVAIVTLVVTQILNAALVPWLGHAGLALSISLGALFNAGWLWVLMRRSGNYTAEPGWAAFLLKVAVALYMMGGVIWYGMGTETSWFAIPAAARAGKLALVIGGAMAAYFVSLWLMGIRLRHFTRAG